MIITKGLPSIEVALFVYSFCILLLVQLRLTSFWTL